MPFVKSKSPLQPCIMVASCPSLRCSYTKEPVSCREANGLVRELWSPRIVTICWLCFLLWYESAANQQTIVKIECLVTVGWKWGYQPFSCPCSQNVTHRRKEICSTCLFKIYIPPVPFWNSKHLLPTRSRFLRATVRSTSSAFCLHYAHPFVAAEEKKAVSCREAEGLVTESDMLLLQCSVCALGCAMWLLQTNEHLSRLSF